MAATIKVAENIPVAVVHSERSLSHLSEQQRSIFDKLIPLPENIPVGFAPKLYLNELTPFDETIFLDADMLWLPNKKPSELFNQFDNIQYTGITEGFVDLSKMDTSTSNSGYHFWADVNEIKDVYKLKDGRIYQWRSEFIYFKKNKEVNKFFKQAQKINENPRLSTAMKFGTNYPDELAINISAAIHGFRPHADKWTPAYWHKVHNDQIPRSMEGWYLISFGGNSTNGQVRKLYDNITKSALSRLGRQHVFSLFQKKQFLPERFKM